MKIALLSSKGQITIPKEMQFQLNIGHRSKIVLFPQKGALIVKPMHNSIVEQTAGSLSRLISAKKRGIPFKTVKKEAIKRGLKKLV